MWVAREKCPLTLLLLRLGNAGSSVVKVCCCRVAKEELHPTTRVSCLKVSEVLELMLANSVAAHMYLSSLCSISGDTPPSTRLQSSTTLIAAGTTTVATTVATAMASASTQSNYTASRMGDLSTSSNATSLATTSITVIIPSVVSISGNNVEKEVVKRGGTAQWALVVVVFARSLMY